MAVETTAAQGPSKGLHIALWVVQVLLFAAFVMAGGMKLFSPEAAEMARSKSGMPYALTYFIGASEVLGGLGMVLPAATRIMPRLTGYAAIGLLTIMVLAVGFHVMTGDIGHSPPALVLGAMAAFVAWGRLVKAPIAPKA
jgi:putative oxidoreductase